MYFACPYRTHPFAPTSPRHDTTRHDTLGCRRPSRQESASRPSLKVGATFAPRRLPVARILAWRHARQLVDCHLESSAILSHPCPNVFAVGWSPRRRQHAVCDLPLAPCARVAMPHTSPVAQREAHSRTNMHLRKRALAPNVQTAAPGSSSPSMLPCSQQCSQSVKCDAYGAAVQSYPPAGRSAPLHSSRGRPGSVRAS